MVATVTPDIENAQLGAGWAPAYQPKIRDMPQGERPGSGCGTTAPAT